jgi:hypothetical protein
VPHFHRGVKIDHASVHSDIDWEFCGNVELVSVFLDFHELFWISVLRTCYIVQVILLPVWMLVKKNEVRVGFSLLFQEPWENFLFLEIHPMRQIWPDLAVLLESSILALVLIDSVNVFLSEYISVVRSVFSSNLNSER